MSNHNENASITTDGQTTAETSSPHTGSTTVVLDNRPGIEPGLTLDDVRFAPVMTPDGRRYEVRQRGTDELIGTVWKEWHRSDWVFCYPGGITWAGGRWPSWGSSRKRATEKMLSGFKPLETV
jgi:hypothetical protein